MKPGPNSAGSRKVEPRKRKRTPSDERRKASRLEAAVGERHLIRSERQPMGWGENRQPILSEDDLRAKDWTRPLRVEEVTRDIDAAYDRRRRGLE